MVEIKKVISGGQTGVDRALLDVANEMYIEYGGWCPHGGLAEDSPHPPGILKYYPKLTETPSSNPRERTEWNVRDSDATLIVLMDDGNSLLSSSGTAYTKEMAIKYKRPFLVTSLKNKFLPTIIYKWLTKTDHSIILNVAGSRESESPGIYKKTKKLLTTLFFEIMPNNPKRYG